MNEFEQRMLDILTYGREHSLYLGVKAEFEAEGTRTEEMIRLSDITRRSGLNLGIKIGGCEAVRDLIDCKQIGADYIIAPMVESAYALSKYIQMKNRIYSPFERQRVRFLFNVETAHTMKALDDILTTAAAPDGADGIVFGRVDYSASCGVSRDEINTDRITNDVIKVAQGCREKNLDLVVGGGVALEGVDALKKVRQTHLTRFETRKIIFDARAFDSPLLAQAFINAGEFELLWLKNKRAYYSQIANEDATRIEMLERRFEKQKAHHQAGKLNVA